MHYLRFRGGRDRPTFGRCPSRLCGAGYTLVEILVATTLSLLLMVAVVRMFGDVGRGITDSRSMLESADRLRLAETRLQQGPGRRHRHDEPAPKARKQRRLF